MALAGSDLAVLDRCVAGCRVRGDGDDPRIREVLAGLRRQARHVQTPEAPGVIPRLGGPVAVPSHLEDRHVSAVQVEVASFGCASEGVRSQQLTGLRILAGEIELLIGTQQKRIRCDLVDRQTLGVEVIGRIDVRAGVLDHSDPIGRYADRLVRGDRRDLRALERDEHRHAVLNRRRRIVHLERAERGEQCHLGPGAIGMARTHGLGAEGWSHQTGQAYRIAGRQ